MRICRLFAVSLTLVAGAVAASGAPAATIARPALPLPVELHAAPGGPVVERLGGRTEFGSPLAFSVARRAGDWVGVRSAAVPNGRLAWIDRTRAFLRFGTTPLAIEVDLSARTLVLRSGGRVLRRATVAVGAPGTPTPLGRFAITDELPGADAGPFYGCCLLALSGTQPRLPAGWSGGNRLAIHGGPAATIGGAVSAGCVRARPDDLRALMRLVPLGTPVTIRP